MRVVVMGVSGSGKTTLGAALAQRLGADFVDADDLHSADNIAHMSSGKPLTDEMRWPWLDDCGAALLAQPRVVLACSALRRVYRNYLREMVPGLHLVYPRISQSDVRARLQMRRGHFMPTALIKSQFSALEPPHQEEQAVLIPSTVTPERAAQMAERILLAR